MKKLLLLCTMSLAMLAMTQCGTSDDGPDGNDTHVDTVVSDGYVDLGLRSMTVWKATNEVNEADPEHNLFTYDEALAAFGDRIPTMEQFQELLYSCRWEWRSVGFYQVFGPNDNYILLPAEGSRDCSGELDYVRTYGFYWSSTPDGLDKAWYLNFYIDGRFMYNYKRCYANSVRLVKDVDDY